MGGLSLVAFVTFIAWFGGQRAPLRAGTAALSFAGEDVASTRTGTRTGTGTGTALEGEWLQELAGVGAVAIPVGARGPRRIVVAVHGAASRPDWMCSAVRASVGPEVFVICPHPVSRFTTEASWSTAAQLRERIDAAVGVVTRRWASWVDQSDAIYIGHSQGAMIAPAALALPGATRFRYALFFEGLPPDATAAKTALVTAGIERLLLVSGQSGWKNGHALFAKSFQGTSLSARHIHADVGHFFNGRVHQLIRDERSWVLGDRRLDEER